MLFAIDALWSVLSSQHHWLCGWDGEKGHGSEGRGGEERGKERCKVSTVELLASFLCLAHLFYVCWGRGGLVPVALPLPSLLFPCSCVSSSQSWSITHKTNNVKRCKRPSPRVPASCGENEPERGSHTTPHRLL